MYIVEDLILYKGKIYLIPRSKVKGKVLKAAHDTPVARHQGYFKTYQ